MVVWSCIISLSVLFIRRVPFSDLTLSVGQHKEHLAYKKAASVIIHEGSVLRGTSRTRNNGKGSQLDELLPFSGSQPLVAVIKCL